MATIAEELAKAAITDTLIRIENPIAAPWVKMNPGTTAGKCQTTASAEGYTPATSFAVGEDDCYYSTSAFASSGTTYIYGIVTLTRIGSTERQTGVWLCRDEGTPVTVQNGYYLRLEKKAGANEIKYTIEKWVAGTPEVIKEFTTTEYVVGSQIAFVIGNNTAYMFGRVVEGAGEFAEKMSVATSTYTKGYSGLRAKGTGEMVVKNIRTGTFTLGTEEAPVAATEEASEVKPEKAKLNGLVDPNLASTKYYFQYCRLEPSFVLPESNTGLPIAVDATWIYFVNNQAGWIGRVKLDGTELNNKWVNIESAALRGLCCNATHIFWVDTNNNNIGRCKIDGTEVNKKFVEAIGESPSSVQVNAANIFWTNSTGIGRATIAGAEKNNTWLAQGKNGSICLNASNIFWTGGSKIGRATIAGGSVEESWVTGVEGGEGLACDAEAIYWGNPGQSAIGRVKLNGTEVINKWVRSTKNGRSIAIGTAGVYVGGVNAFVPAIGRAKFLYIPESKEGSAGSGGEPTAVSQNAESLAKATEYTFRVVATNAKGESIGAWKTFLTGGTGIVSVLVGGVIRNARRWILVKGSLVNK